eukprot:CAMPEP_0196809502 /NCGR_PEP_ID=MMETSP1362-20130617/9430_1 /TAXON_ID=163516 /ORGANISM="Leptocylindrus danicus, Strain CCMP1856" /LENGTH=503 /DNA_ID=CAMNT_0042184215 /DNA_START=545 /DNA_END=2056 /DNA_ORIENTATION=+
MPPPESSPKHVYLTDSPGKHHASPFNFMEPSPTLQTVATTVLQNFPKTGDKVTTENILKSSAPPTPFPELEMDQAKLVDGALLSPSAGVRTPKSADPAFSWLNMNSPTLKSPKIGGNFTLFSGNFFSDAADLGFAGEQQSPMYLKQNAKPAFSPVSTRPTSTSANNSHTDVTMEAERDLMEDEDMIVLLQLAQSQGGASGQRTPLQRNGDSTTTTTSDILTASSLHLPHIPPVANNAFRASSKDDKIAKSEWQPPLLKSSGSFHSTKITRMDSYGTNGVGISKLSIAGSKSGDAGETKVEDTKAAAVTADVPKKLPNILIPNNNQVLQPPYIRPNHQMASFRTTLGGPGFLPMPPVGMGGPVGYPVSYRPPPTMNTAAPVPPNSKKKTPSKKRIPKSKSKTPSKKRSTPSDGDGDSSGLLRGVTMRPSGKWQAQLYYAGKSRYIGVFDTRENAATAYEIARQKLKNAPSDGNAAAANSPEAIEAAVSAARQAAFEGVNMSLKK